MAKTNTGLKAQLQVSIDIRTAIWLNQRAESLGKTVPDLVRQIIDEYINEQEKKS
jgi:predicted DNA-binding protein